MDIYTTGDIAKLCHVAPRTVIDWIDAGLLKAYTLPASKHRRITKANLLAFLKEHGMPTEGISEAEQTA